LVSALRWMACIDVGARTMDGVNPKATVDQDARSEHLRRWAAVETFQAQELAAMTDERAREKIHALGAVEGWRERPDWSGLIEQQAIFKRARRA
jgi:hypothetical protein